MGLIERIHSLPHKTKIFFELLLLLVIIGIAVFLRFWQINSFPPGLYADVAANGLDGLNLLRDGDFRIVYPRNAGREGMYYWYLALVMAVLGTNYVVNYIATGIAGVLTVLANYIFARKMFGRFVALASSFFLATSFFHMHYSRLGYRTILVPIFVIITLYAVNYFLQNPSKRNALIAGVASTLGMYTYISYRAVFFGLILALIWHFYWNREQYKRIKPELKRFGVGIGVGFIPFIVGAILDPVAMFARSGSVLSIWTLPENILRTAATFGIRGDHEMQYNIGLEPAVPLALSIFFLYGIWHMYHNQKQRNSFTFAFLLLSIAAHLAIVAITDRVPHMLRASGMLTPVMILAGIGLRAIIIDLRKLKPNLAYIFILFLIPYLIYLPFRTYDLYFEGWVQQENLARREFFTDYIALGNYLNENDYNNPGVHIVSNWYQDGIGQRDSYILQTTNYIIKDSDPIYRIEYNDSFSYADSGTYIIRTDDGVAQKLFFERFPEAVLIDYIFEIPEYQQDPDKRIEIFRVYNSGDANAPSS
ncbi:MAG: ArnT family glycosyltransferase [Candidatus Dojkabacteria bacterium]